MNIESKRYSVRAIGGGLVQIYDKASRTSRSVRAAELPGVDALASMTETQFDRTLAAA